MTCAVVIATYNGEKYIKEQLYSIIKQSRKPDNIIVIDDQSSDDTSSIAEAILRKHDIPFKVIVNKKNLGPTRNFFEAINYINEEVIFFSDQDDIWLPEKIMKMMMLFEQDNKCSMVICDSYIWGGLDDGKKLHDVLGVKFEVNNKKQINKDWYWRQLVYRNIVTGMNMAINLSVAKNRDYNIVMLHDAWYALIAPLYGTMYLVDEPLVKYRQHDKNVKGANRRISITKIKDSKSKISRAFSLQNERIKIVDELDNKYKILSENNKKIFERYKKLIIMKMDLINQGKLCGVLQIQKVIKNLGIEEIWELKARDVFVTFLNLINIKIK